CPLDYCQSVLVLDSGGSSGPILVAASVRLCRPAASLRRVTSIMHLLLFYPGDPRRACRTSSYCGRICGGCCPGRGALSALPGTRRAKGAGTLVSPDYPGCPRFLRPHGLTH